MGEPYSYPETVLYGKKDCRFGCNGQGTTGGTWEEGGEPCECIHDQLIGKHDFIRLADGEIEIRPWDAA